MAVELESQRRLFTADEFERMVAAGVFAENERLELIDGEIVVMTPVGPGHGMCIAILNEQLVLGLRQRAVVWLQSSARVTPRSVPQPDLALLRRRSYRQGNPTPDDILLVVEVADSSLRYERTRKLELYATAGVAEYWVVNVTGEWVEVHRSPEGRGYRDSRRLQGRDTIAPLAFPDVAITVADLFA